MGFLPISDLAAAQAIGADIRTRTFVDGPDLAWGWYQTLRSMGFTPVPATPDAADIEAQAPEKAERATLAAQLDAMSYEDFRTARNAGWQPGEPIPGAEADPPTE